MPFDWGSVDWGSVIGGAASAVGAYQQSRNHNAAAAAAGQPQQTSQVMNRTPWGPADAYLQEGLGLARQSYLDSRGRVPVAGGGRGASSELRGIASDIRGRAGSNTFVDDAQGHALGMMGSPNSLMSQAFYNAGGGGASSPYLGQFIQQGFGGGFDPSSVYMQSFLQNRGVGSSGDGSAQEGGEQEFYSGGGRGPSGAGTLRASVPYRPSGQSFQSPATGIFNDVTGQIAQGDYLNANEHLDPVLDAMQRRQRAAYDEERARLDTLAEGGVGRFGSSFYENQAGRNFNDYQVNLADQQNAALLSNYQNERGHQMAALGLLDNNAQWRSSNALTSSQIAAARAGQSQSYDLQNRALDLQSQGLTLDAINSYSGNSLAGYGMLGSAIGQDSSNRQYGLGIQADLAGAYGNQQLGALGMVPGLNAAGYDGLQAAYGAQQGVDQLDRQAAAGRQRGAVQGWQMEQQALQRYLANLQGLSGQYGVSSGQATSPGQYVPTTNPWVNAAAAGVAGYSNLGGSFGGGSPGVQP